MCLFVLPDTCPCVSGEFAFACVCAMLSGDVFRGDVRGDVFFVIKVTDPLPVCPVRANMPCPSWSDQGESQGKRAYTAAPAKADNRRRWR